MGKTYYERSREYDVREVEQGMPQFKLNAMKDFWKESGRKILNSGITTNPNGTAYAYIEVANN